MRAAIHPERVDLGLGRVAVGVDEGAGRGGSGSGRNFICETAMQVIGEVVVGTARTKYVAIGARDGCHPTLLRPHLELPVLNFGEDLEVVR